VTGTRLSVGAPTSCARRRCCPRRPRQRWSTPPPASSAPQRPPGHLKRGTCTQPTRPQHRIVRVNQRSLAVQPRVVPEAVCVPRVELHAEHAIVHHCLGRSSPHDGCSFAGEAWHQQCCTCAQDNCKLAHSLHSTTKRGSDSCKARGPGGTWKLAADWVHQPKSTNKTLQRPKRSRVSPIFFHKTQF
jgi:hypothetical protein